MKAVKLTKLPQILRRRNSEEICFACVNVEKPTPPPRPVFGRKEGKPMNVFELRFSTKTVNSKGSKS